LAVIGEHGGVMKQAAGFGVGILETVAEQKVTKVLVNKCAIYMAWADAVKEYRRYI
jgi:hypothetical protein